MRAPVARCAVRGLPPLGGACRLRRGPIPTWIWCAGVAIAAAMAAAGVEVALLVAVDGAGRYALTIPEQDATPTRVRYRAPALPLDTTLALTLHSHHRLPAYFSAVDDRDERGLGLYGVLVVCQGASAG